VLLLLLLLPLGRHRLQLSDPLKKIYIDFL
jgi:hypothetical protein